MFHDIFFVDHFPVRALCVIVFHKFQAGEDVDSSTRSQGDRDIRILGGDSYFSCTFFGSMETD